jgi:hypothetical protein
MSDIDERLCKLGPDVQEFVFNIFKVRLELVKSYSAILVCIEGCYKRKKWSSNQGVMVFAMAVRVSNG